MPQWLGTINFPPLTSAALEISISMLSAFTSLFRSHHACACNLILLASLANHSVSTTSRDFFVLRKCRFQGGTLSSDKVQPPTRRDASAARTLALFFVSLCVLLAHWLFWMCPYATYGFLCPHNLKVSTRDTRVLTPNLPLCSTATQYIVPTDTSSATSTLSEVQVFSVSLSANSRKYSTTGGSASFLCCSEFECQLT